MILVIAVILVTCKKNNEVNNCNDVTITVSKGRIQSPQWLAHKVDSLSALGTNVSRDPWVYIIKRNGKDYVAIWDVFYSTLSDSRGLLLYRCSGETIDPQSDWVLYRGLKESFQKNSCHLLWKNPIDGSCDDITYNEWGSMIVYPQWLYRQIDSLRNFKNYRYSVYSVEYDKKEYICHHYQLTYSDEEVFLFYTCFGKTVVSQPLYSDLYQSFLNGNCSLLLWR